MNQGENVQKKIREVQCEKTGEDVDGKVNKKYVEGRARRGDEKGEGKKEIKKNGNATRQEIVNISRNNES